MVEAFLILGLSILVGYVALLASEKYRIPQVLILILFGFLLGPVLGVVDGADGSLMRDIYPFMATLALIILLFDGGLSFNIFNIFKTVTKSTVYMFAVFALSIFFSLALAFVFGMEILHALIIGTIVGGTCSATVITMVENSKTTKETKALLTTEAVLTDSLVIITVFIIIQAAKTSSFSAGGLLSSLLGNIAISLLLGALAAYAWNMVLQKIIKKELDYMLTIGVLFITYPVAEALGGNGGLSIFVFGLVFANLKNIPESFLSFYNHDITERIRDFQGEVTFFTRTFLFIYIGLLFPLNSITPVVVAASLMLIGLFIIARYVCAKLVLNGKEDNEYDKGFIVAMIPRGLAAAVLVGVVSEKGVEIPYLEEIVFSVIVLTNVVTTASMYLQGRGNATEKKAEAGEGASADDGTKGTQNGKNPEQKPN